MFWLNMQSTFSKELHPFHLVDPSPWPLLVSISALNITSSGVLYMHNYKSAFILLMVGFTFLFLFMYRWFGDIVLESTFEGNHTKAVVDGLKMGMILFIVSEVMFFFSFFWSFFHSAVSPSIAINCLWPPLHIQILDPWVLPFDNTAILLMSGVTVTWCHRAIYQGALSQAKISLFYTVVLGVWFIIQQYIEYTGASFSINDSIYGSVFYMATGFHGFHVIIGTIFLFFCLIRLLKNHFTIEQHFGFDAAAWYWHFVDVVWLFLFVTIYWWSSINI